MVFGSLKFPSVFKCTALMYYYIFYVYVFMDINKHIIIDIYTPEN